MKLVFDHLALPHCEKRGSEVVNKASRLADGERLSIRDAVIIERIKPALSLLNDGFTSGRRVSLYLYLRSILPQGRTFTHLMRAIPRLHKTYHRRWRHDPSYESFESFVDMVNERTEEIEYPLRPMLYWFHT